MKITTSVQSYNKTYRVIVTDEKGKVLYTYRKIPDFRTAQGLAMRILTSYPGRL